MLICFDIDGVLIDLDRHFREIGQRDFGLKMERVSNSFIFHERYSDLSKELENKLWRHLEDNELWSNAPLYDDALYVIQELRADGHELMCLSAAPIQIRDQRIRSLEKLGIKNELIFCAGTGMPNANNVNKREILKTYMPDVFIDDQLHNLIQAKEVLDENALLGWIDLGDTQINLEDNFGEWGDVAYMRGVSLRDIKPIFTSLKAAEHHLKVLPY